MADIPNPNTGSTIAQFLELLESTAVLSAEDLTALQTAWPVETRGADANSLARDLVQQEKLTKYQAAALYQGKTKGLLIGSYFVIERLGDRCELEESAKVSQLDRPVAQWHAGDQPRA